MTQPAVTFQIKQLEEQYNARLFERRHGGISLTPAGEVVLEYAERILGLSEELETRLAEMTGEMRGNLLVGASTTVGEFMLPTVLAEFNDLFPQVRTRLIVGNTESIRNRVAEHALDLGVVIGEAKLSVLQEEHCVEHELSVVCAAAHPLVGMREVGPDELADYEYLAREPGSGTRDATDAYFRAAGIAPETLKMQMELGSPAALARVVETGCGFAIMANAALTRGVAAGVLVAVPLKPRLICQVNFLYPKERFRSRLVSAFVDFAKRKLREQGA